MEVEKIEDRSRKKGKRREVRMKKGERRRVKGRRKGKNEKEESSIIFYSNFLFFKRIIEL